MNPKDEIKERLSIIDVVSTYVRLEKSGSQYKARCPFHNEKTPSFYVSMERKNFHCFGCGAQGDIFSFVEKIESIPFYDALKILADRAGVTLISNKDNHKESRLIALLKDATSFFEKNYNDSAEAKSYVVSRGILDETRSHFHIGYAKNEWRTLFMYLASCSYTPEEMEESGLVIKAFDDSGRVKGWYDRFRGRVMFPIRNVGGNVVGFTGRILPALIDETKEQAKYVNTPETALYHKSKILFGYDTAKKKMSEVREVIVVEGQMDLVMSYQSNVHNTIAVSGTAFTDEHINLIKRFADRVIFSFDSDNAGQSALKKSAMMCLYAGLDVYVVGDFGKKDPADAIVENPDTWHKAIENKKTIVEHVLIEVMKEKDERMRGRLVVSLLLPYVRAIQSGIDRNFFITLISKKAHIEQSTLLEELKKISDVPSEIKKEELVKPIISDKEKREIELTALVLWKDWKERIEVKELELPYDKYPEEIITARIFDLEKKMAGDPEKMLKETIQTYKKELQKEEKKPLDVLLREDKEHENETLEKIHRLTSKVA